MRPEDCTKDFALIHLLPILIGLLLGLGLSLIAYGINERRLDRRFGKWTR